MPRCQSHTHRTTVGPTQTHGYMHTTEEEYKCIHKSSAHKIMGESVHGCTSPSQRNLPQHRPLPLNLLSWPNKAQACPIGSIPILAQDRPYPACPGLLGWGSACSPLPAASSAQGTVPCSAGYCSCTSPAPPPPLRPATSASETSPGLHLAHFCRQWAGCLIPRAGVQEEKPADKTPGGRENPGRAFNHHPVSFSFFVIDPSSQYWASTVTGHSLTAVHKHPELQLHPHCLLTHRYLSTHEGF